MPAIPPIATELAPRIGPKRCANRGLNPPQQTSWTGGSNGAGVVRPSASAGVRLRRAYGAFRLQELSGYFRRAPPGRSVDNDAVKIDVHLSIDDRLARQHFRRRIPRLLLDDAVLNCLCDQFSDLFTLQRDQLLIGIIPVKLRTIIQRMDPWIVSFQNEVVLGSHKNIVLCDDFLFQGGQCNPKLLSRRADDGSSLQ